MAGIPWALGSPGRERLRAGIVTVGLWGLAEDITGKEEKSLIKTKLDSRKISEFQGLPCVLI